MRQWLKSIKVERLAKELNLPIADVSVRGGCNHDKLLLLQDGTVKILTKLGQIKEHSLKWK